MSEVKARSLPWLQARLAQWQRCCRMQDWRLEVRIRRDRQLSEHNRLGETDFWKAAKRANLDLVDPVDYADDRFVYDQEQTLAHEFAHVLTYAWPWDPDKMAEHREYEQAVEAISYGLCAIPVDFEVTE